MSACLLMGRRRGERIGACSAMLAGGLLRVAKAAALSLSMVTAALAVHYDVALSVVPTATGGLRIVTDIYGDLLMEGLPVDTATGHQIFPGYFGDLEGGPLATDDPGFQAFKGTFVQGEIIYYRALGRLEYWNPATSRWGLAPAGVQLALYGGMPPDIALGHSQDPVKWEAQYAFHEAGTRYHRDGVSGPVTAFIDDARRDGAFHSHLDWKISAGQGTPAVGAYLVTLQLWSSSLMDGRSKYIPSRPIKVLFERGITQAQWQAALKARLQPPLPLPEVDATSSIPRPPWALPGR